MNIYVTSETEERLQNIIINIKNFYIFDVQKFIELLKIDITKPSNVYFVNSEIMSDLVAASKLKKYQGIIYINKNLSEHLYHSLKNKFNNQPTIEKFILIDNGNVSRHKKLHDIFDEVFFYERFRKCKIFETSNLFAEIKK